MENDKLVDYSGAFDPTIGWGHFSREKLVEALGVYGNLFLAIDGFWYLAAKERFGDEVAMDLDLWAWDKYLRFETKRLAKLLNITGQDVDAFLKILHLNAWSGNVKIGVNRSDQNHAVFWFARCPTLEALIKEGEGREQYFCRKVEVAMFQTQARALNPQLQVSALRLPPETIGGDLCCQWEVTLPQ